MVFQDFRTWFIRIGLDLDFRDIGYELRLIVKLITNIRRVPKYS